MKVLVTGADGFIGKNTIVRLREIPGIQPLSFVRGDSEEKLQKYVEQAKWIIHLAGVNRPENTSEFESVNSEFTKLICGLRERLNPGAGLILTSSIQVEKSNPYGESKLCAEEHVRQFASSESASFIYRLPNVFGKWCKPNYNSVVATFCHNISQGLPIRVDDPDVTLDLVYVDDVIDDFLNAMKSAEVGVHLREVGLVYHCTLQELVDQISSFANSRDTLVLGRVGVGLQRALYATYVSYLRPEQFSYKLQSKGDARGDFVEVLKTKESGQFSVFSAKPGITRGGHYHHTKTEKFLVLKGQARFGFKQIITGSTYSINVKAESLEIVETVPGWAHDITNVGSDELIVLLWANEIFDEDNPDTIGAEVGLE